MWNDRVWSHAPSRAQQPPVDLSRMLTQHISHQIQPAAHPNAVQGGILPAQNFMDVSLSPVREAVAQQQRFDQPWSAPNTSHIQPPSNWPQTSWRQPQNDSWRNTNRDESWRRPRGDIDIRRRGSSRDRRRSKSPVLSGVARAPLRISLQKKKKTRWGDRSPSPQKRSRSRSQERPPSPVVRRSSKSSSRSRSPAKISDETKPEADTPPEKDSSEGINEPEPELVEPPSQDLSMGIFQRLKRDKFGVEALDVWDARLDAALSKDTGEAVSPQSEKSEPQELPSRTKRGCPARGAVRLVPLVHNLKLRDVRKFYQRKQYAAIMVNQPVVKLQRLTKEEICKYVPDWPRSTRDKRPRKRKREPEVNIFERITSPESSNRIEQHQGRKARKTVPRPMQEPLPKQLEFLSSWKPLPTFKIQKKGETDVIDRRRVSPKWPNPERKAPESSRSKSDERPWRQEKKLPLLGGEPSSRNIPFGQSSAPNPIPRPWIPPQSRGRGRRQPLMGRTPGLLGRAPGQDTYVSPLEKQQTPQRRQDYYKPPVKPEERKKPLLSSKSFSKASTTPKDSSATPKTPKTPAEEAASAKGRGRGLLEKPSSRDQKVIGWLNSQPSPKLLADQEIKEQQPVESQPAVDPMEYIERLSNDGEAHRDDLDCAADYLMAGGTEEEEPQTVMKTDSEPVIEESELEKLKPLLLSAMELLKTRLQEDATPTAEVQPVPDDPVSVTEKVKAEVEQPVVVQEIASPDTSATAQASGRTPLIPTGPLRRNVRSPLLSAPEASKPSSISTESSRVTLLQTPVEQRKKTLLGDVPQTQPLQSDRHWSSSRTPLLSKPEPPTRVETPKPVPPPDPSASLFEVQRPSSSDAKPTTPLPVPPPTGVVLESQTNIPQAVPPPVETLIEPPTQVWERKTLLPPQIPPQNSSRTLIESPWLPGAAPLLERPCSSTEFGGSSRAPLLAAPHMKDERTPLLAAPSDLFNEQTKFVPEIEHAQRREQLAAYFDGQYNPHQLKAILSMLLQDRSSVLHRDNSKRLKAVELMPVLEQLERFHPDAVTADVLRPILSFVLDVAGLLSG